MAWKIKKKGGGSVSEREVPPPQGKLWRAVAAAILSLFFAGLGHFFLEEIKRGMFFFIPASVLWIASRLWPPLSHLNLSLFIFAAFDSYSIARRGFGILFDKRSAHV